MMTKDELIDMLHNYNMEVTFTKKDNTERTMICTLADDLIPEDLQPKGTGVKYDPDQVRVFDLEKEEWRSFLFSSVTSIERAKV